MPRHLASRWHMCTDFPWPITALIENYTADPPRFREIQATIQGIIGSHSGHTPQPTMPGSSANGGNHGQSNYALGKSGNYAPPAFPYNGTGHTSQPLVGYGSSSIAGGSGSTLNFYKNAHQATRDLQFKPSPFYCMSMRIGEIRMCDGKKSAAILSRRT